ncbi:hypothetical protein Agub_g14908 [Astrephomene gubernaculifera]|uniref:Uncharacterized protein n=1 Tax=Astrephomene gubernaculifera TaxID=47775 RepID=A0AAD3HTC4_9CHLO|nr:hypothetical protein Agub_g14908 [Astrephomene gubernaculifera]
MAQGAVLLPLCFLIAVLIAKGITSEAARGQDNLLTYDSLHPETAKATGQLPKSDAHVEIVNADASQFPQKQRLGVDKLGDVSDIGTDEDGLSDVSFLLLGASPAPDGEAFCSRKRYRKRTLKVVKEMPFAGLFPELQRIRRFEGSGVTHANGSYYVVFDSLRSLGQVDLRFSFRGPENRLVGAEGGEQESQFEGISYNEPTGTFFVVRESFQHDAHGLVPVTEELQLTGGGSTYKVLERCPVRFPLQDVNKGFESLVVYEKDGVRHLLGLCESNFCATIHGPDAPGLQRGNGRLVWARYRAVAGPNDECSWEVEKVIDLPSDVYFVDYSAIAFRTAASGGGDAPYGVGVTDVAVASQEDAAVWVGTFDWETMEFVTPQPQQAEPAPAGRIYHFPRTGDCSKQYCNVEGVAWIDAERLVLTSDKSKSTQDWRCMDKDQSVHIMALP